MQPWVEPPLWLLEAVQHNIPKIVVVLAAKITTLKDATRKISKRKRSQKAESKAQKEIKKMLNCFENVHRE